MNVATRWLGVGLYGWLSALVAGSVPANGGVWPADIRLDTDPVGHNSSCLPQLAGTPAGRLHVVWQDYRGPTWAIYYRRSADWGNSWLSPDLAISTRGDAERPRVATDGANNVYAVWQCFENGEERVCFSRSTNGGATWLPREKTLNTDFEYVQDPVIACNDSGHVYVAWAGYGAGTEQIFFNVSADAGMTWLANPMRINTNTPGESWSEEPRLACDDAGHVYVAYIEDQRAGAGVRNVFFRHSPDYGNTWDVTEARLDATLEGAGWLDMVAGAAGEVHVAWAVNNASIWSNHSTDHGANWLAAPVQVNGTAVSLAGAVDLGLSATGMLYATYIDARTGTTDVYANVSTDGGLTWTRERLIAPGQAGALNISYPQIAGTALYAYVAWMDARNGYYDIYIRETADQGLTWSPEVRVNTCPAGVARSAHPQIYAAGGLAAIVWDDRRAGEGAPDTYFNLYTASGGPAPRPVQVQLRAATTSWRGPVLLGGAVLALLGLVALGFTRARGLLFGAVLMLAVVGAARAQTLDNGRVRFEFEQNGTNLTLVSAANAAIADPIGFQPGTGRWEIYLRDVNNYANVLVLSMEGDGCSSLSLGPVFVTPDGLTALWTGTGTFLGVPFAFEVQTHWTLEARAEWTDTSIHVSIVPNDEAPFYIAEIDYPYLHVPQLDATDQLAVPLLCGYLHENPISDGPVYPVLNDEFPRLSVPVLGYYGESSGRCLYFGDNDTADWWKTPNVTDNPGAGRLEFRMRHFPDDIFESLDFATPYGVRIGALNGDWVTVAQAYREFMTGHCAWYHGPVASPANPMPEAMKQLVAHAQYGTSYEGDNLDIMARDMVRLTRVFGAGVYTRWYGCHWPDKFDAFYNLGYLPGRPTFAAAIRESEKQAGQISAPYIQGTLAYDYSIDPNFVGPPTPMNLGIYDSTVILADGSRWASIVPFGPNAMMCNAAPFWSEVFVQNTVDIADLTHMHGAYLDYYGTVICYSAEHDHLPGGGTYPIGGRIAQLHELKTRLADLPDPPEHFGLSMEVVHGRYSEEIHMMFTDPLNTADDGTPRTVVPFFHYVHDNVKVSRIVGGTAQSLDPGYSSWVAANNVFTFGQIIGIGSTVQEVSPTFLYRPLAPFYRFMKKICGFLRDEDFFRWHNGTLVRLPDFAVTNAAGFAGQPGHLPGYAPLFVEEVLTPGMYQAVDGTLAFVVANPWVGDEQRDFDFVATFRPTDYPGFTPVYAVAKVDDQGNHTYLGVFQGDYVIADTVATGEILHWIFYPMNGDYDRDGDTDCDDLAHLADCLWGPDLMPAPPLPAGAIDCQAAFDFDVDEDVDLVDCGGFQMAFDPR